MVVRSRIKASAYYDSVTLMLVQREIRALPGVVEAGVVMGTGANKDLLRAAGLLTADAEAAKADDLVICLEAEDASAAEAGFLRADELLTQRRSASTEGTYRPKTIASALRILPGANLALISVPGRFAAGVGREALEAGLHVMMFSDNVPLEAEVELKNLAHRRGRLLMGPDCGTAMLGGVALGFANRVRQGPIGIVGASGTGIQEVATLIHRGGGGISHALGTGGRDLNTPVGGATMFAALGVLARDPGTEIIVLISKPPSSAVASRLLAAARSVRKPMIVHFVGGTVPDAGTIQGAATLEAAARLALEHAGHASLTWEAPTVLPAQEAGRLAPTQRYIRGLYSGGTLCAEALGLLEQHVGPVYSNVPLDPTFALSSAAHSREHTVIDLGADEFTVGRLHPMIDPELRHQRLLREADDPTVAVILIDVVLGYGAHADPAGALVPIIHQAQARARAQGRWLPIVASVCGTDLDPQPYQTQVDTLVDAGVMVQGSNVAAVCLVGLIAEAIGHRGRPHTAVEIAVPADEMPLPPVGEAATLLATPVRVINVGLELFAESLTAQQADVIAVDWQPPAGGKQNLIDLLDKLNA